MKYKFLAQYSIDGKKHEQPMEYDSADVIKTLERRLTTAFPNATSITITETK